MEREFTDTTGILQRILRLQRFYNVQELVARDTSTSHVIRYYRGSALGYRLFHSRDGSIHMALNPSGTFSPEGYRRQVMLVQELISQRPSIRTILELGCGRGFNLSVLSSEFPECDLLGIDLTPTHVHDARRRLRSHPNVAVDVGNFEDTDFAAKSFDFLFSVESFCHASNPLAALREVRRISRDGATLAIIDAWRTDRYSAASGEVQAALRAMEKVMAVGNASRQSEWLQWAADAGWQPVTTMALSHEVMPNLERFESLAERFLSHQTIAHLAKRVIRGPLLDNAVAGYLMADSVRCGLHTYDMLVLRAGPEPLVSAL